MSELNVRLKDMSGNVLYPASKGSLIENNAGETLGGVEAGAQVNVIENVTVNGQSGTISGKTLAIQIDAVAEYSIEKQDQAETGYSATYVLKKGNEQAGDKINIPKDLVVESGSVKTCSKADEPVEGYKVGDKYIDMVLANSDSSHIYVLVSDLVDTYTEGDGIKIQDNEISVDTTDTNIVDTTPTENSTKFVQSGGVYNAIDSAKSDVIDTVDTKLSEYSKTTDIQAMDNAVKADIYKRIWSNPTNPDKGYFQTKYNNANGSYAMVWNESDGGGSMFYNKESNVKSFVGVNEDSADATAVNMQIYAIDDTTKVGTRLNTNTQGIFYVKGGSGQGNPAGREIAVKDDIADISEDVKDDVLDTVAEGYYSKAQAEQIFLTYDIMND